jgi:hypothetical protein
MRDIGKQMIQIVLSCQQRWRREVHTFFSLPCPLGNASVRAAILAKVFGEGNHRNRVQRQPPDRYFAQGGKNESKKKKLRRSMWLPTEVTELAAEYHPARGGPPRKREWFGGGQTARCSLACPWEEGRRTYSSNQPCNSASAVCHRGCGLADLRCTCTPAVCPRGHAECPRTAGLCGNLCFPTATTWGRVDPLGFLSSSRLTTTV